VIREGEGYKRVRGRGRVCKWGKLFFDVGIGGILKVVIVGF
jgi:hypothetical protein